jgi:hypothetical protein
VSAAVYEAGARTALAEASVGDLVTELGRRSEPGGLPSEAEVARLVAGQEERLRVLEAYTAGLAALVRDAAELLAGAAVHEVGETHDTWASVRRAVVLGQHVSATDVQQWMERAGALLGNTNSIRRTG